MENQRSLQEPLLPSHYSTHGHQQKDVIKRKKLRRSRSAPIIVCIPRDLNPNEPVPTPEPRFPKLHPSVRRVTAFLSIYLGIGAICFYIVNDQLGGKKTTPIVDALYFCVVTMTTVGYGDLAPQTAVSKILACAFVFSGMALVVLVLSKAADYLVEKQEGLIKRARRMRRKFRPDDIQHNMCSTALPLHCRA